MQTKKYVELFKAERINAVKDRKRELFKAKKIKFTDFSDEPKEKISAIEPNYIFDKFIGPSNCVLKIGDILLANMGIGSNSHFVFLCIDSFVESESKTPRVYQLEKIVIGSQSWDYKSEDVVQPGARISEDAAVALRKNKEGNYCWKGHSLRKYDPSKTYNEVFYVS